MGFGERAVAEVMQTEVASLASSDRLDLVEDIMRLGRIRHLPVLEGSRLEGIVSSRDLLAASLSKALDFEPQHRRSFIRSIEVREVMTRELVTVEPDTTLRDAAALMLRRQIGCLPVVKPDGTLLGLVTESDLVRMAYLSDAPAPAAEAGPVLELERRLDAQLDNLRRLRDELRVQLQLGKAEVRDAWDELEGRFHEAESQVRLALRGAEGPAEDLVEAARALLNELADGYRRLRDIG